MAFDQDINILELIGGHTREVTRQEVMYHLLHMSHSHLSLSRHCNTNGFSLRKRSSDDDPRVEIK